MRKKYDTYKNIRTKDRRENFTYYLIDIDTGIKQYVFILLEKFKVNNQDQFVENWIDLIQAMYHPTLVNVVISSLGKWEYDELKERGVKLFNQKCKN